jgi:hypothetical protein
MSLQEAILQQVGTLPPEKQGEVLKFANSLASSTMEASTQPRRPLRDPYGMWADFDIDISEEDIAELRREMWKNFPREDI